ncbi:MAG: efflux RND transporter permease subunit, partial [Candidatus Hydrothermae bacterium]|nr:efflux RND transporter permease subunit [Candidatus Hydrothermae bacterium]
MIERLISWSGENRFLVFSGVLFLSLLGLWSLRRTPLDAIPDLTDPQVILHTEWMGRSPELVEEQITYPIATKLLSAPRVQAVRGYSMFGNSFVYVIFEEGTDLYWARSRVVEYLSQIEKDLPEGVTPTLGPDATGLGWVFQYALVDTTGTHDLAQLRSFNDWYLRYALQSVPGVAEVAPIGGYVKEYQVILDPTRLAAYGIPVDQVMRAIRMSNRDVGGRNFEWAGREVIVRGLGYVRSVEDLAPIA